MAVSRANWKGNSPYAGRSYPKQQKTTMDNGVRLGFRSGLEAGLARQIEKAEGSCVFEDTKVRYTVPESRHTYTPDFRLANGILIESKGKFEPSDRQKHVLISNQYGDELDIRFVFQRANDPIRKGSLTTYGMWATKFGFKWSNRVIPDSWFSEPGPKRKPEEVLKDVK